MYVYRYGRPSGATSWYYEFQHAARRERRGGFPTKRLAEVAAHARCRELLEDRVHDIYGVRDARPVGGSPTLATYATEVYLVHHVPRLAPATQITARSHLRRLVRQLGRYRLDELTPAVLDQYVTARREAGMSAAHVREEITRLSGILNFARGRGELAVHPFSGKGWRWPRGVRRDIGVLTAAEEARLLQAAGPGIADVIAVALDTGLRKGELRLLTAAQVDWTHARLRVLQGKTQHVKVIPLTRRATTILRRRWQAGGPYLLGTATGAAPWSLPWIDTHWRRALRAAKVAGVRFHDLRHTFASRLADRGEPVPVVGELLGHRPPYTTTLRYYHGLPEAAERAIRRLESPDKSPYGRGVPRSRSTSRRISRASATTGMPP